MSREVLKLTALLGERDRGDDGRLLVDHLADLLDRHDIAGSVVLRGTEGFGLRRRLATGRLLTLSEDLPLMAVATDQPERIGALVGEADAVMAHGLITLERAQAIAPGEPLDLGAIARPPPGAGAHDGAGAGVRLTCHVGRGERIGGVPAYRALVDGMRDAGMDAAVTLLGVDGTRGGARVRARFFATNSEVPVVISAVGDPAAATRAATALALAVRPGLLTAERVTFCVRAGVSIAPLPMPDPPGAGVGVGPDIWQKVTVHLADRGRHAGPGAYLDLLGSLREAGAAGATVLRGTWGFQGRGPSQGDRPLAVPRRAPLICLAIDRPVEVARWFDVVAEATRGQDGLAFVERVPALRARTPGHVEGALAMARGRW